MLMSCQLDASIWRLQGNAVVVVEMQALVAVPIFSKAIDGGGERVYD